MVQTTADLRLILTLVAAVPLGAWFFVAIRAWYQRIREQADVHVDPIAEPVRWARTGPSRLRILLTQMGTQAEDPDLELLRRQTLNRLIVAFLLTSLAMILGPAVVTTVSTLLRGGIEVGNLFGLVRVILVILVGGYFAYRLGRAAYRFGNGRDVRSTEFIVSIVGIVSFLFVALYFVPKP